MLSGLPLQIGDKLNGDDAAFFAVVAKADQLLRHVFWDDYDDGDGGLPANARTTRSMRQRLFAMANERGGDDDDDDYQRTLQFLRALSTAMPAGLYAYAMSEPWPAQAFGSFIRDMLDDEDDGNVAVYGTGERAQKDFLLFAKAGAWNAARRVAALISFDFDDATQDLLHDSFKLAISQGTIEPMEWLVTKFRVFTASRAQEWLAMALSAPVDLLQKLDSYLHRVPVLVHVWRTVFDEPYRLFPLAVVQVASLDFVLENHGRDPFSMNIDSLGTFFSDTGNDAAFGWLFDNFRPYVIAEMVRNPIFLARCLSAAHGIYADGMVDNAIEYVAAHESERQSLFRFYPDEHFIVLYARHRRTYEAFLRLFPSWTMQDGQYNTALRNGGVDAKLIQWIQWRFNRSITRLFVGKYSAVHRLFVNDAVEILDVLVPRNWVLEIQQMNLLRKASMSSTGAALHWLLQKFIDLSIAFEGETYAWFTGNAHHWNSDVLRNIIRLLEIWREFNPAEREHVMVETANDMLSRETVNDSSFRVLLEWIKSSHHGTSNVLDALDYVAIIHKMNSKSVISYLEDISIPEEHWMLAIDAALHHGKNDVAAFLIRKHQPGITNADMLNRLLLAMVDRGDDEAVALLMERNVSRIHPLALSVLEELAQRSLLWPKVQTVIARSLYENSNDVYARYVTELTTELNSMVSFDPRAAIKTKVLELLQREARTNIRRGKRPFTEEVMQ